jgi:hypothetical protein
MDWFSQTPQEIQMFHRSQVGELDQLQPLASLL